MNINPQWLKEKAEEYRQRMYALENEPNTSPLDKTLETAKLAGKIDMIVEIFERENQISIVNNN